MDLTSLMVAPGNCGCEVTIGGDHDKCDISLRCTCDHVLDEVTVTRCINDGVVPFLSEEFFGGACNGHTTLALLLLAVHVEGKDKGSLAQSLGLCLKLLKFTLRNSTKLKEQPTCGGAFATVDMAADDNGEMLLFRVCWHGVNLRFQEFKNWNSKMQA